MSLKFNRVPINQLAENYQEIFQQLNTIGYIMVSQTII